MTFWNEVAWLTTALLLWSQMALTVCHNQLFTLRKSLKAWLRSVFIMHWYLLSFRGNAVIHFIFFQSLGWYSPLLVSRQPLEADHPDEEEQKRSRYSHVSRRLVLTESWNFPTRAKPKETYFFATCDNFEKNDCILFSLKNCKSYKWINFIVIVMSNEHWLADNVSNGIFSTTSTFQKNVTVSLSRPLPFYQ